MAIAVVGCSKPADPDVPVNLMTGEPEPKASGKPFDFIEKTALLDFAYAYPADAAALPALAAKLEGDMRDDKADALNIARQDKQARTDNGAPFRPHEMHSKWAVTASTAGLMALLQEKYVYADGAHGMTTYKSLVWDKQGHREIELAAMMTSPDAFSTAVRDRFCEALDAMRAQKRSAPVVRDDSAFSQCLDPINQTLALTSSDGRSIDGLAVVVAPYQAGPYAEGSYRIALPATPAMVNAIRPEYRRAFHAVAADPPPKQADYMIGPVDGGIKAPSIK